MNNLVHTQKIVAMRFARNKYVKPLIHSQYLGMESGIAAGSASISTDDTPQINDWEDESPWESETVKMPEY